MTFFMTIVVIALFIVVLGFTWYRLEAFERTEKLIICVAGILLSWGLTAILFSMSSSGINYTDPTIEQEISKILVLVFTPINGLIYMPYIGKIISQIKFEEITVKDAMKKILVLLIIMILIFVIEVKYLKNVQQGIFEIANRISK